MATPASRPAPERIDGYVALRSYAAIGDGRTVALIAEDGDIDWLPLPNLHTAPAFAAILDAPHGGRITLRPDEGFEVTRAYVPGTNVLTTTFTTASGSVRVTDALVTGVAGRLPWSELGRRIEGLTGEVAMSWVVAPGTALGTSSPWVQSTHNGPVIRVDGVTLAVVGLDQGPAAPGTQSLSGAFTAKEGSRHVLTMVGTEREPVRIPNPEIVDEGIDRTIRNWEGWSAEFRYEGEWAEAVQRSALALKLLVHAPTGSIAAAATTSLPERMGGGKNWDYRFAWVRDLAYTVNALVKFGLREETHAAVSWMLRTSRDNGPDLHVFYSLEGGVPEGSANPEVPGWRGVGPVVGRQRRAGAAGAGRLRRPVRRGAHLRPRRQRARRRHRPPPRDLRRPHLRHVAEARRRHVGARGRAALHDLEARLLEALDCAVELAELGQIPGVPDRWRAERDRIRTWVEEECWDEGRGAYVMHPGSQRLDASILLHSISGFDRGARMSSTLDALRSELGRGPRLYRYSGMPEEEGTFTAGAFWLAGAYACVGRMDEARELMDQLVDLGNDVGLYSEMIDADDHAFLGNLPQGLSHLALVSAALTIDELSHGRTRSTRTPRAKR